MVPERVPSLGIVDYSRQEAMNNNMDYLHSERIQFIVGCGGVGFWVGLFLAMNGSQRFVLMDGQDIENSNLNRLPIPLRWVGMNKARALKRVIKTFRPDCVVQVLPSHMSETTLPMITEVLRQGSINVWDCTDNAKIQTQLYRLCLTFGRSNVRYKKLGYEGFTVGAYSNFDIWFTDEANYRPGYRTSSANAMSSAMAACVGIFACGVGCEEDVKVDFRALINRGGFTEDDNAIDAELSPEGEPAL